MPRAGDPASGPPEGASRRPAVEGLFYPSDVTELQGMVRGLLDRAGRQAASARAPGPAGPAPTGAAGGGAAGEGAAAGGATGGAATGAVIAPHAGYRFSGETASFAYEALSAHRGVERVVVIGPAHRVPLEGVGLSTAGSWSMSYGPVEIDGEAARELADLPGVVPADEAHRPEHSIEVQLPFIREALGDVPVVPLVVGRATPQMVARVVEALWDADGTVVVASSDLSHYLDDEAARARDLRTVTAVLEGRAADIGPRDACGCLPIGGLLAAASGRGLAARLLHLSTSADATGDPSRVVGYGSFSFHPPPALGSDDGDWLLDLATRAITEELEHGRPYLLQDADVPLAVRRPGASFVTLTRDDQLAGCIGSLRPQRPLWWDVARNARAAAFEDPRFPPVTDRDLADLTVEVSVLSPLDEVTAMSADELAGHLRPGVDGVVLAAEGKRGTFLPDVWDRIPDPGDFLRELARKACWDAPWVAGARAWRYTTDVFTRRFL